MLSLSILGIALVKTGLVPTKISALGVDFSQANQKSIFMILALIVIYFPVAFVIYAATDFIAWRLAFRSAAITLKERRMQRDIAKREGDNELELVRLDPEGWTRLPGRFAHRLSGVSSLVRAAFEFVLPIVVGVYSVVLLLSANVP